MGGEDQVKSLKEIVRFRLTDQMAVGGALFELESILSVPDEDPDRLVDHGMVVEST